jgi:thiamine biosynthesis lipoprotein
MKLQANINNRKNQYNIDKNQRISRVILIRVITILYSISSLFIGCSSISPDVKEQQLSSDPPEFITKSDFLLNTVVSINLYDKQEEALIDGCFDLIRKYETIYSRTDQSSELYALNHGISPLIEQSAHRFTYSLSEELADILKPALAYSELTGGAFDLTIAPITSLWDFQAAEPALPGDKDLAQAIALVDYKNVQLSDHTINFAKEGIGIDLGAIAKGYIADRVKEYLLANGVQSAMINLGGNILCVGSKPDHSPFHIGIQKPYADRNETIAVMELTDLSVVSSGVYERFFELDGRSYHHILNPKTGYPYDNGIISVTIISEKSVDGDGLSTSCFALGLEKGLQLIESLPNTYAVFITDDYELHYSSGFDTAIQVKQQ